ncbi:MAG: LysM peptidoglycan-binding domain-containing protein, partial [Rhodocyclaceae bacterium]|nr:LysM peptidoglycan-binding domain-containing protein [Rhodocyclaceae bacterium]
ADPATMALTRLRVGDTVGGLDLLSQALADDPAALSIERLGAVRHAELADAISAAAAQRFATGDVDTAQHLVSMLNAMAPFDPAVDAALMQRLGPWLAMAAPTAGIEPAAGDSGEEPMMYTVRRGDTLWSIARRTTGDGRNWRRIFERHNMAVDIGRGGERIANPHRLVPGQKVRVPLSPSTGTNAIDYHVAAGESLSRIAARIYGDPQLWRHIQRDNADRVRDPNRIYPGQVLVLTPRRGAR